MIIIGVDFHPVFQQIAFVDSDNGEFQEKRLTHREEAEQFYRALAATEQEVRIGMEASGTHAGLSDCWVSCSLSCGWETPPRSRANEPASRRRVGKMRSIF
jgi:hypothetical protein